MGVSSCTGPSYERGVQVCNAGWGMEMWGAPCELQYLRSNSKNSQVSDHFPTLNVSKISMLAFAEAPALEEYKYSASVQSLLLLLRLVMTSECRMNS